MLLFLLTLFFFYEPAPSEIYTLSLHDALPIWCSSRKVNSSSKETYVTNLLVLDPENSSGTNYAVEVWEDKPDRKSTRLNSSHLGISYAVFCLKKKRDNDRARMTGQKTEERRSA